jgi:WD40 repeat protein
VECWGGEPLERIFSAGCSNSLAASYSGNHDKFAVGDWHNSIWLFDAESGSLLHKIETPSGIQAITFSPDDRYLASGHDDAAIRIWDVNPESPRFKQCAQVLEVKMICQGMQVGGVHGVDQKLPSTVKGKKGKQTLLEFFADRGAVLDAEQLEVLKKIRKSRKTDTDKSGA